MKSFCKTLFISIIITFFMTGSESVFAGASDSAGYWLDIIPDARSSSMGGANTAIATSALAAYWNPACLYKQSGWQSTYLNIMAGMQNYLCLAVAAPVPDGTVGASIMTLTADGIRQTIYQDGRPLETGNALNLLYTLITATYATESDGWQQGISCKLLSHQLAGESAAGIGIDIGAKKSFGPWAIGATKTFLPITLCWSNGTSETIQSQTRIGIGYQPLKSLMLAMDINLEKSSRPIMLGTEFQMSNIAFRFGYGGSTALLNFGAGIVLKNTILDVSYSISEYAHVSPAYRLSLISNF